MVSLAKSSVNVSPESPPRRQSINFSRNPSPNTMSPVSPLGTVTPATYKPTGSNSLASGASTPATYHTATAHRHSTQSMTTNTTNNPVSPPTSAAYYSYAPSPNLSRNSLVNQSQQHQQQNQHPLSPTVSRASLISQASRMALSPPSADNSAPPATPAKDVNRRGSRGALSGMSPTVQALYGQHERDWRRSQNVLPEELVARGLDEGVFAGLRG
jgi:hypothetical protein